MRATMALLCLGALALLAGCGDDDAGDDTDGGSSEGSAGDGAGGNGESGRGASGSGAAGTGAGGDAGGSDDPDASSDGGPTDGGGDDGGSIGSCDCGDPPSACIVFECVEARCEERDADDGAPIAEQTADDCEEVVCDGEGGTRSEPDDDDVPNDDNPCTVDACDDGDATHEPSAPRTECDVDDGVMCDGDGACVDCVDETDCVGDDMCQAGLCVPAECMNEEQDGDETDEDCGGGECAPCGPGLSCMEETDCAGGDCGGDDTCVANCDDGVQNNTEVDTDCGPGCDPCGDGSDCSADEHCDSGMCYAGSCAGELNGCDIATAMDLTGMGTTTIAASSFVYTPPCIQVSVGTVVTVTGNSVTHPFTGGRIVGTAKQPATSGPFMGDPFTDANAMFTMSSAGSFPFYCNNHGPSGMKGTVFVVP
jgi:plastocyanin